MNGFSIIVCCYNSATRIEKTVEYLVSLETKNFGFEIIIVDNNSSDNTYNMAVGIAEQVVGINIFAIREPRSGKSNALIAGISEASYDCIVVCDDDNWLNKDYLLVAYEVMQQNADAGILGGRGIIHTNNAVPNWFADVENAWAVGEQAEQSGKVTNVPEAVWGAGMVIRKKAWELLFANGFKEFLTGRSRDNLAMAGEDTELCILVALLGYNIYYEERLIYQHDLSQKQLSWQNLKKHWEGFSRSSVYFDMYDYHQTLSNSADYFATNKKLKKEFKLNLQLFFSSSSVVNFFKIIYIAFIKDRPGYLPGLEKRKFLFRLKELWRIRSKYSYYLKIISKFKYKESSISL